MNTTIRYKRTLEDYITLNKYVIQRSPSLRRGYQQYPYITALAVFVLSGLFAIVCSSFTYLVGGAVGALFMFLITPWLLQINLKQMVTRIYNEAQVSGEASEATYAATPEGLLIRTNDGETKVFWKSVESADIQKDYTYLSIGKQTFLQIPHRDVGETERVAFLRDVEMYRTQLEPVPAAQTAGWWQQQQRQNEAEQKLQQRL